MVLKLRGKQVSNKYRFPAKKEINFQDDLWGERREWLEYDYPQIVLLVILLNKKLSYDKLIDIMKEHEIPVEHGFPIRAINLLEKQGKISVKRGKSYALEIKNV